VHTIDLRSDTVTRPTPGMRRAMTEAEVGDDVYGEDPSVNRLQEVAAKRMGLEAALFVPTGSMANQVALRALGRPGDVALCGVNAHMILYESGAPWALSGIQVQTIGSDGLFDGEDVRRAVHPDESHFAPTRIVEVENTHNRGGGRVFPLDLAKDVAASARQAGLALHLDGARIFNAEVATGTPASAWGELFDTVSFCLSKGLGAPVGSLSCGRREHL
jgi:threonine aldolase